MSTPEEKAKAYAKGDESIEKAFLEGYQESQNAIIQALINPQIRPLLWVESLSSSKEPNVYVSATPFGTLRIKENKLSLTCHLDYGNGNPERSFRDIELAKMAADAYVVNRLTITNRMMYGTPIDDVVEG